MKKINKYLLSILLLVVCLTFVACGGSTRVNYDLTTSDTYATSTIENINNDPYKFKNKTLKVWGKFKGNKSYYKLEENNSCCRWQFEVKLDNVSAPASGTNVTVVGKCVVTKVNGSTKWYLAVTDIN